MNYLAVGSVLNGEFTKQSFLSHSTSRNVVEFIQLSGKLLDMTRRFTLKCLKKKIFIPNNSYLIKPYPEMNLIFNVCL